MRKRDCLCRPLSLHSAHRLGTARRTWRDVWRHARHPLLLGSGLGSPARRARLRDSIGPLAPLARLRTAGVQPSLLAGQLIPQLGHLLPQRGHQYPAFRASMPLRLSQPSAKKHTIGRENDRLYASPHTDGSPGWRGGCRDGHDAPWLVHRTVQVPPHRCGDEKQSQGALSSEFVATDFERRRDDRGTYYTKSFLLKNARKKPPCI